MEQRRVGEYLPVVAEQERAEQVNRVQWHHRGVLGRHSLFTPDSSGSTSKKEDNQSEKGHENKKGNSLSS